jgi:hypothetical protein
MAALLDIDKLALQIPSDSVTVDSVEKGSLMEIEESKSSRRGSSRTPVQVQHASSENKIATRAPPPSMPIQTRGPPPSGEIAVEAAKKKTHVRSRSTNDATKKPSDERLKPPEKEIPKPKPPPRLIATLSSPDESEIKDDEKKPSRPHHQRARSEAGRGHKRKDSKCYPFSEKHIKKHNSNLDSNTYVIPTFDEYLKISDQLKLRKTQSAGSSEGPAPPKVERKPSKPLILEARKRKSGHARTQSHPEFHTIEVEDNSDALVRQDASIYTEPYVTPEMPKLKRETSAIKKLFNSIFS